MARYKPYDLNQSKMIPLSYADQIVEGSFEHALNDIVEEHLDLSIFDKRYANDDTGRLAYDPRILLKVVLYGYYKGITSSRMLAESCRRNVVFMALSADTRPHFTTLAAFVSELDQEIVGLFRDVLLYASELGLIGKEHFAVDGCKLPSNASKQWSGTHHELNEKRKKLERVAERIVVRHRDRDRQEHDTEAAATDAKKADRYQQKVAKIKEFLQQTPKKQGPSGNEQKSNVTDPDSAKMSSSRGVLQGYNGLAVVDDHAQIVVHAEAHGSGYEGHLLAPLIEATRQTFFVIDASKDIFKRVKVTADSGFHSKAVLSAVEATGADAYIADREYRRRDPAFAGAARHKERDKKERALQRRKDKVALPAKKRLFSLQDFHYDQDKALCICPAGHKLYQSGNHMLFNGYRVAHFKAPITACRGCPLRSQCLRHPERSRQRQLTVIKGRDGTPRPRARKHAPTERMRFKFDSPAGRAIYCRRMPTVEPVFANLQNKGMRRFTLRGRSKVNAQWQLFTIVHNIEKIAHRRGAD
ncbi:MAG: IS1182 family transposase [Polyangiaceae bacterium]|nr:IS1182 family transposase [Polyangiaceae bacterium]